MAKEDPYLGQGSYTPYSRRENSNRAVWAVVQMTAFRWSPRTWHGFRARLLKWCGADIPDPDKVVIFPTVTVVFPSKLSMAPRSMIGPRVRVYNLAPISFRRGANVSQGCHLCAGSHDYSKWGMPLIAKPIEIGENSWLGADVFVGPGVTIGTLCVIGARSVVIKDVAPNTVAVGNPCKAIKARSQPSE